MTEEDVIRRRLLIDGDGTGDDRRLNVLLKTLIKWCNSNEMPEESKAVHDRMLAQLAQCEFAVTKSQLASQVMAAELENYEKLSHSIEKGIENAKKHIDNSKVELKKAKTVRKNRIEYDVLAKVISQQPDRKETEEILAKNKKELESLDSTKILLERRLDLRRKQFHVLMSSMHQLQSLLDEDNSDEVLNISLDDIEIEDSKEGEVERMEVT